MGGPPVSSPSPQSLPGPSSPAASLPDNTPHHLDAWQRLPRLPLTRRQLAQFRDTRDNESFIAALLIHRIHIGKPVTFTYHGGSTPGQPRTALPTFLFTVPTDLLNPDLAREPFYLLAHCTSRNAPRTFRLDRIRLA